MLQIRLDSLKKSSIMYAFGPLSHFCAAPHKYWVFWDFLSKFDGDLREKDFAPQKRTAARINTGL